MVSIKSILKCNGIYEWLLIRFFAVLMLLYVIYIVTFIILIHTLSYEGWYDFFSKSITKVFSVIALLASLGHTWIGMRHVLEDYIKLFMLKRLGMWVINSVLLIYLVYGIILIWSI